MSYSKKRSELVLLAVFVLLVLSGCTSKQVPATEKNAPTLAPSPTDTMVPTATLTPTVTFTPKPTNTPRPTNTPSPTPTFTPTPAPIVLKGSGDSVVDVDKWDGPALLKIKYRGYGNFVIWNYGANGEKIDLLVNTIGNYEGTRPLDFLDGEFTRRLQIEAAGKWEIQILPLREVRQEKIPGTIEGQGDDVVYIAGNGTPDLLKVDASKAKGNFAVWGYGASRDLLVNEIAPYTGTTVIPSDVPVSGKMLLVIEAEGPWSLQITTR